MKQIIILLLALIAVLPALSQTTFTSGGVASTPHQFDMRVVYDKTNYTASLAETTAWFIIEPYRELAAVLQSTDSANADVYFDARNSTATNTLAYTTFQDSLKLADSTSGSGNMNLGGIRNTLLKTTTLNRLNQPGNYSMRIRAVQRSTLTGTTSGRHFKVWLIKTN